MSERKLRPWVKVVIAILIMAILAFSFDIIATTTAPCTYCGEPVSAAEAEIAAVEGSAAYHINEEDCKKDRSKNLENLK